MRGPIVHGFCDPTASGRAGWGAGGDEQNKRQLTDGEEVASVWCFDTLMPSCGALGPLGFNSPNIAQRHALP